jgi:hypothetical protein
MALRIKRHDRFDITVFQASGVIFPEQITDALKSFYRESDTPTQYALWDLRKASLTAIDHWEAVWITQVAEYFGHGRANGKTAIVVSNDYDFEISRLIAAYIPLNVVAVRACRTIAEAAEWFGMDVEVVNNLTEV